MIVAGFVAGSFICIRRVLSGSLGVGDFVLFLTYLQQLYQPLNWLGTYWRMIHQNYVDMEKMMDLLGDEVEVKVILFRSISLHYFP